MWRRRNGDTRTDGEHIELTRTTSRLSNSSDRDTGDCDGVRLTATNTNNSVRATRFPTRQITVQDESQVEEEAYEEVEEEAPKDETEI
jgi:hypothetical protein